MENLNLIYNVARDISKHLEEEGIYFLSNRKSSTYPFIRFDLLISLDPSNFDNDESGCPFCKLSFLESTSFLSEVRSTCHFLCTPHTAYFVDLRRILLRINNA